MSDLTQSILDSANMPETLDEMGDLLDRLQETIITMKNCISRDHPDHAALSADFDGLNSLAHYVGLARGERAEQVVFQDRLTSDPLAMVDAAERYRVIDADDAAGIRAEFMAKVRALAGVDLKPAQVKALFRLMQDFNPLPPALAPGRVETLATHRPEPKP